MKTKQILLLSIMVLIVAVFGSLYVSFFGDPIQNIITGDFWNISNGFTPCAMCWYSRICLFPLVLICSIAYAKKDWRIWKVLLSLSVFGLIITAYNYALEMKRIENMPELCGFNSVVKCGNAPLMYGGWFTLSLAGFLVFLFLLYTVYYLRRESLRE